MAARSRFGVSWKRNDLCRAVAEVMRRSTRLKPGRLLQLPGRKRKREGEAPAELMRRGTRQGSEESAHVLHFV